MFKIIATYCLIKLCANLSNYETMLFIIYTQYHFSLLLPLLRAVMGYQIQHQSSYMILVYQHRSGWRMFDLHGVWVFVENNYRLVLGISAKWNKEQKNCVIQPYFMVTQSFTQCCFKIKKKIKKTTIRIVHVCFCFMKPCYTFYANFLLFPRTSAIYSRLVLYFDTWPNSCNSISRSATRVRLIGNQVWILQASMPRWTNVVNAALKKWFWIFDRD